MAPVIIIQNILNQIDPGLINKVIITNDNITGGENYDTGLEITNQTFSQIKTFVITNQEFIKLLEYIAKIISKEEIKDVLQGRLGTWYDNQSIYVPQQMMNTINANTFDDEDDGAPGPSRNQGRGKKKKRKPPKTQKQQQQRAVAKRKRKKKRQLKMKLKEEEPELLPFSNIDMNAGKGNCVVRLLKRLHGDNYIKYSDASKKNANQLINYADKNEIRITLWNVMTQMIYCNNLSSNKKLKDINALIHNGHIYQITSGYKPRFNKDYKLPDESDSKYVYVKRNTNQVTSAVVKDKLLDASILSDFKKHCMNQDTYDILTKSCKPLFYSEGLEGSYFTYDIEKAYLNKAMNTYHVRHVNMFSEFIPYKEEYEIFDEGFYIYRPNIDNCERFGIKSNVCTGRELRVLIKLKCVFKIDYVLSGNILDNYPRKKIKELYENNKDFNMINGMCGKTQNYNDIVVHVKDDEEREAILEEEERVYLCNRYVAEEPDKIYEKDDAIHYSNDTSINYNNRLVYYLTICGFTNAQILEEIYKNIDKYGYPIKIHTDSLTYKTEIECPEGWKSEEFKFRGRCVNEMNIVNRDDYRTEYDNVCITGAGGVGKSYHVKKNMKYDYACSFQNDTAYDMGFLGEEELDVKGQTIHKLFNLDRNGNPLGNKCLSFLRDMTIWMDEFAMIPSNLLPICQYVYIKYNTRFIFTGAFNQLSNDNDLKYIPFFGKLDDWDLDPIKHPNMRMSPRLVKLSKRIDNGEKITFPITDKPLPLTNIAATNEKRHEINRKVMELYNLDKDTIGCKFLCKKPILKLNIFKGSILTLKEIKDKEYILTNNKNKEIIIPSKYFKNIGEYQHEITRGKNKGVIEPRQANFDYGFCTTIHSSQGKTIYTDLGIHEQEHVFFKKKMKYVAVTRVRDIPQLLWY